MRGLQETWDDQCLARSGTNNRELAAAVCAKSIIAGAGFMCDAYDLFVMNMVMVVLSYDYAETDSDRSLIAGAVLAGSVVGQLLFGVLADYIGRRKGFIATLSLLIVGAAMSAAAVDTKHMSVFAMLALWRFVLGVGIGGEYPLAATVSSEASVEIAGRGRRVAGVFSMQGVGSLLAPLVILLLLKAAGPGNVGAVWRVALGLGAVPGVAMIYFRITMTESVAFTRAQQGGAAGSGGAAVSFQSATVHKLRELAFHWRALMGTAGSWLIFDIAFYANGLFSSTILSDFYERPDAADPDSVHVYLNHVAVASLYLSLCALPGYWASMLVIDRIGRRRLQLIGYTGMIITYTLCGALLKPMQAHRGLFFFLYGTTFFFCNFGPNVTTFVIPSEAFPTSIRATAHGLSAAAGKVGAVIGGAMMPSILASTSLSAVMFVCAAISVVGWAWTWVWTKETGMLSTTETEAEHAQHDRDDDAAGHDVENIELVAPASTARADERARIISEDSS